MPSDDLIRIMIRMVAEYGSTTSEEDFLHKFGFR
jgi:hypothetical protein